MVNSNSRLSHTIEGLVSRHLQALLGHLVDVVAGHV